MEVRRGQKLKLLYLIEILKHGTDEDHPMSAQEICRELDKCGVSAERKSIYSDIDYLMNYGYDIIYTRVPKPGYFLASREFETPEIYLLCDAIRTAKFITPKKSRELVQKLQNMLSTYQMAGLETGLYISADLKCRNEEIFYNIDAISRAIAEKKKISFKYGVHTLNENREVVVKYKQHVISPYAQTWQDDHYYLLGNYDKYDNIIHFRIDRIRSVSILDEKARPFSEVSEYKEIFDVADYTRGLFNMFGGKTENIELKCEISLLEQIIDRFGVGIFVRNVTDTHFSFSVKAVASEAFITFIMNFGNRIEIIGPAHLRESINKRISEIKEVYS